MNLFELFEALIDGELVRNENWELDDYIYLAGNNFVDSQETAFDISILCTEGEWELYDEDCLDKIDAIRQQIEDHKSEIEALEDELGELGN